MLSCLVWRDDGLAAAFGEPVPETACIVGPVGDQALRRRDAGEQVGDSCQVVGLAWRQGEGQRPTKRVAQGVNLSRPSAPRSPDGLGEVPPFAPAAERWALTWVLSTAVVLTIPLWPLRA